MTKYEADVIGGLNMTDQISNEAYKQIMIATQDENEVGDVLDKIRDEIEREADYQDANVNADVAKGMYMAIEIIDKTKGE